MPNKKQASFDAVTIKAAAECFHTTRRTIEKWVIAGCPKNPDGTISIYQIYRWKTEQEIEKASAPTEDKKKSLKDRKTEKEIERLEAQISKIRDQFISKDIHDQVLSSRAKALSIYLETAAIKNAIHYMGKTLEQVQAIRFQESKEAMEAYVGSR
jgi:hypothetical protein